MSLPTGTITFLFTDIEGSTRLWEAYPAAMPRALARHDVLLRRVIGGQHGGHVFKTVGDAFCAAFDAAPQAARAAVDVLRALAAADWDPVGGALPVRVALHTGTGGADWVPRGGDYFGPALNRIARLLAIGHGGQILLSDAARTELMAAGLPEETGLRDQGAHRLKDLAQPEHVWQLLHPDLVSEFPPLASLSVLSHNLPLQTTSFIGREDEMRALKQLLTGRGGSARLLTLTGPGGCGKTRLALQVAADVLEEYSHGVWLAELAAVADPALAPGAVASVLGVREATATAPNSATTPLQPLVEFLREKRLLLVLDNAEHLLSAVAPLAETLLRTCPGLQILATSREALNIAGEQTYHVPSLSLPDPRRLPPDPECLARFEAVRLFVDRATLARSDFAVTSRNAPALAQVCHRLDGIPLAIELAAARVRALSVEQIATRLDDRFRLLTGGSRTALPRQQTLRALIDWSYDLLEEWERTLLRRLSVFVGGWTLDAAEAVCAGYGVAAAGDVLDSLTALVDKSLVLYAENEGAARYRLLETVRQYACDRLLESGESEMVRGRHRDWFVEYALRMDSLLKGPESDRWWGEAEPEYPNLRAALEWSFAGQNEQSLEAALRLLRPLATFWRMRGNVSEGRQVYASILAHVRQSAATPALAEWGREVLHLAGHLANRQGDYPTARALFEEGLRLSREQGDLLAAARALNGLGYVAMYQNDFAAARTHSEEALKISQANNDTLGIGSALYTLGHLADFEEKHDQARSFYEEAMAIWRDCAEGQNGVRYALLNLGHGARRAGDFPRARFCYQETLRRFVQAGDRLGVAQALEGYASLAVTEQQSVEAARDAAHWYGAAESLREAVGTPMPAVARALHEEPMRGARAALGEEAFGAAWAEGRALTQEQAVACVLEDGTQTR